VQHGDTYSSSRSGAAFVPPSFVFCNGCASPSFCEPVMAGFAVPSRTIIINAGLTKWRITDVHMQRVKSPSTIILFLVLLVALCGLHGLD
jgi:hypothetical protein